MPIDLSNVNISLAEFQRISEGTYNAGEVRLKNTTKLARMNHHVHFTSLNKTEISHAEVLAIKDAFVKALSENHVPQDQIDSIRKELGLKPTSPGDQTFHARSLKPLSRQMIREILDRTISSVGPESGVRSSEQIYGKGGMKESRMNTRNEINANLDLRPHTVDDNERISNFQNVITGDVHFKRMKSATRNELIEIAREQLNTLMERCEGKPSEDVPANASFTLPGGQTLTISTGLSQAQLSRSLEDTLIRLEDTLTSTTNPEDEARSQFGALSTQQQKLDYLGGLKSDDERDALKARAVVVMLLSDNGVSDYESLSVPNRLNFNDVIALAKRLVSMGKNLTPDIIKGDQVFKEMAAKHPAEVPENSSAYIPAVSNQKYNKAIQRQLTSRSESAKLPLSYIKVLDEAIKEIRDRMGEDAFPDVTKRYRLLDTIRIGNVISDLSKANIRVTPENIRQAIHDVARVTGVKRIIENAVKNAMTHAGYDAKNSDDVRKCLTSRCPELDTKLASAESPKDVADIIASYKTEINDAIERQQLVQKLSTDSMRQARQTIADKFGVSADVILRQGISFEHLQAKISALNTEFLIDKNGVLKDKKEITDAFGEVTRKFVDERISYLNKVDALELPQNAKEEVKLELMSAKKINFVNLDTLFNASKTIDTSKLETLLKNNASKEEVYKAMLDVSEAVRETVEDMLANLKETGPDERDGSLDYLSIMLVKAHTGLDKLLDDFLSRPEVKNDRGEEAISITAPFRRFSTNPEVNDEHEINTRRLKALFPLPTQEKAGDI